MIVAGTVNLKLAETVRTLYDQMPEPKWVVAFGACANTGGPFREYPNVLLGVDKILPVDIYVPGCPPRPESIHFAFRELQKKIRGRAEERLEAARDRELRGVAQVDQRAHEVGPGGLELEEQRHHEGRPTQRQGDTGEHPPVARAVDLGRA